MNWILNKKAYSPEKVLFIALNATRFYMQRYGKMFHVKKKLVYVCHSSLGLWNKTITVFCLSASVNIIFSKVNKTAYLPHQKTVIV